MIINPTFSDENSNFINEYNHISFLSIELPWGLNEKIKKYITLL